MGAEGQRPFQGKGGLVPPSLPGRGDRSGSLGGSRDWCGGVGCLGPPRGQWGSRSEGTRSSAGRWQRCVVREGKQGLGECWWEGAKVQLSWPGPQVERLSVGRRCAAELRVDSLLYREPRPAASHIRGSGWSQERALVWAVVVEGRRAGARGPGRGCPRWS